MTSPDGLTWTSRSTPGSNITDGIGISPSGLMVTSNRGNNDNLTSTDGITWVLNMAPNGWTGGVTDMQFGNGLFCASSSGSIGAVSSSNGIDWSVNSFAPAKRGRRWRNG